MQTIEIIELEARIAKLEAQMARMDRAKVITQERAQELQRLAEAKVPATWGDVAGTFWPEYLNSVMEPGEWDYLWCVVDRNPRISNAFSAFMAILRGKRIK